MLVFVTNHHMYKLCKVKVLLEAAGWLTNVRAKTKFERQKMQKNVQHKNVPQQGNQALANNDPVLISALRLDKALEVCVHLLNF